ncbi:hypothetical protein [Prochlorococcus marinus]|uniref:hypothetical protein n=1 Tax=Prochlorococcus marinus TaxID=1219 RepID=UPI0022B50329|nr:hypothetical protein [Prochlorococcus marinus]
MSNLTSRGLSKKRVLKAERLQRAQLAAFKKGVFTSYKSSVFEDRQKQALKKLQQWSLKSELN